VARMLWLTNVSRQQREERREGAGRLTSLTMIDPAGALQLTDGTLDALPSAPLHSSRPWALR
jgi:hypothetical protein